MIDLAFYVGNREICTGKWPYVPADGMRLRLEMAGPMAGLYRVVGTEGMGVEPPRSRTAGPVPALLCRGVRVLVEPVVDVPDSPGDLR